MANNPSDIDDIRYDPAVFDVATPDQAKAIILQAPDAENADRRWQVETPWFADFIARFCSLSSNSRVLDFGCGIGRLAKGLIERVNCNVVGVDISDGMLRLAADYVASTRFKTASYATFSSDPQLGDGFDAAFACYVLQHVERPDDDLDLIVRAVRAGCPFLLVNSNRRWVPTNKGWAQDHFNVVALADERFKMARVFQFPIEAAVAEEIASETVVRLYERRR